MDFREAIRKRPGMYFGDTKDGRAANHVVLELVGNAIDQFLAGKAHKVIVQIHHDRIVVQDDGPGLPFAARSMTDPTLSEADQYFQVPHFTATAKGHAPHIHIAPRGVGLAVVAVVCDEMNIRSDDGTRLWRRNYQIGRPVGHAVFEGSTGRSGTVYDLRLSNNIVGYPNLEKLEEILSQQAFLYPGLRVELDGQTWRAPRGLLDLGLRQYPPDDPPNRQLWSHKSYEQFRLHVALLGEGTGDAVTRSWVNGCETVHGGSHIEGVERALAQHDWAPAVTLLHVVMENPEFAGPTKDRLNAPHMVPIVEAVMNSLLSS